MKLNLGCGNYKREGYVNCDVSEDVKPDKIIDLEKKLPFKDDTITDVYSRHTLEHIGNFIQLMEEIWRICKNGARIEIIVPYFAHPGAFQDPTHKRFFTLRTFDYFDKSTKLNYYSRARFRVLSKTLVFFVTRPRISKFFDFFINKNQKMYERFFSRILPAEELRIILEVEK